jgi:hypothetical protein
MGYSGFLRGPNPGRHDQMLFEPDRHEPLIETPWDEAAAREAIARIATDSQRAFTHDGLWPLHPLDRSPERAPILKPIYYGAAGVIWALHHLHEVGATHLELNFHEIPGKVLVAHRADSLALYGKPVLGYQTGDAGILLLQWVLAPTDEIADELFDVISANADHPALGFLWGGAGSMLAALFMFERTGEARWRDLYLVLHDKLWQVWSYEPRVGCHLWMTDLYGSREQRMSALHGLPGIAFCMLKGMHLLEPDRRRQLIERSCTAIRATALIEDGYANWPLSVGDVRGAGTEIMRVQHCVGAPGIVNCFASLAGEPDVTALLIAAGELTWLAGPLAKPPSLCHGTPGNGYAFLKLYACTGDERWLDRARWFGMHAIDQERRFLIEHGQRKFSLWTGALGLAVYLWHCINATEQIPTLDHF